MNTPHPQEILSHLVAYMQENGIVAIDLRVTDDTTRGDFELDERHCPVIEADTSRPSAPYVRNDGTVLFGARLTSAGFGPTIDVTFSAIREATEDEVAQDKARQAAG